VYHISGERARGFLKKVEKSFGRFLATQKPSNPLFYWPFRKFAPVKAPALAFCLENYFARRALGPPLAGRELARGHET
jgi:hypothetical protein